MQLVQETDLKKAIEHLGYGTVINAMAEAFISYSKGKQVLVSSDNEPKEE